MFNTKDEMDPLAFRVAERFSFKYDHKETKVNRVVRLTSELRKKTGLSRSMAEAIVDAIVRGRDVEGLAIQKNWPIGDGIVRGPSGEVRLEVLK